MVGIEGQPRIDLSRPKHGFIAFTFKPGIKHAQLRDFSTAGPETEYYVKDEPIDDIFINQTIHEREVPRYETPSTKQEAKHIQETAKCYWKAYDDNKALLHKYEKVDIPQVNQLYEKWNVTKSHQKKKIKEQYIYIENRNSIKENINKNPEFIRYRWKDIWQVASAESATNNKDDTLRIYELEEFKNERHIRENHPWSCLCTKSRYSCLQQRYLKSSTGDRSFKALPSELKHYSLFCAISEHEQDQGEDGFEASMVGGSFWSAAEKRRFFVGLDRCGRHQIPEIAKRIGPTKTIQEVAVYLNILEQLSKANPVSTDDEEEEEDPDLSAREMSPMFIIQEERMADQLIQRLETDAYRKHMELLLSKQFEKPEELFELWNMSALTKLFTGAKDITILISSIVQYYELLRYFIHDIITTLYTDMTKENSKLVSKKRMNRVIAKRRQTWKSLFTNKPDARLKNMDVQSVIDKKRLFHEAFSRNKSASFLAKKRQKRWRVKNQKLAYKDDDDEDDDEDEDDYDEDDYDEDDYGEDDYGEDEDEDGYEDEGEDDDEEEDEKQEELEEKEEKQDKEGNEDNIPTEEEDNDDTDELSEESDCVNEDDLLDGEYYLAIESESEEEHNSRYAYYEANELDDSSSEDEDEIESQNKLLDKEYEKKLSKKLGFITSSSN